eukprot:Lithocolla_globosa_v1_NODE_741_length_3356_cov_56.689488.p2 type:complete len:115 gc:universal NODE_741_length_3356_cov_56.689488:1308-964(-)
MEPEMSTTQQTSTGSRTCRLGVLMVIAMFEEQQEEEEDGRSSTGAMSIDISLVNPWLMVCSSCCMSSSSSPHPLLSSRWVLFVSSCCFFIKTSCPRWSRGARVSSASCSSTTPH